MKDILWKLMNASLLEEVDRRLERMEYDSYVTIHDDEGNVIETIKIIGD